MKGDLVISVWFEFKWIDITPCVDVCVKEREKEKEQPKYISEASPENLKCYMRLLFYHSRDV